MIGFITFIDKISMWFGKAFAWLILLMTLGMSYEVLVRYLFGRPTVWAFDLSYMMYGALFMMAGAYALSRNAHVRADFIYRVWPVRTQAIIDGAEAEIEERCRAEMKKGAGASTRAFQS